MIPISLYCKKTPQAPREIRQGFKVRLLKYRTSVKITGKQRKWKTLGVTNLVWSSEKKSVRISPAGCQGDVRELISPCGEVPSLLWNGSSFLLLEMSCSAWVWCRLAMEAWAGQLWSLGDSERKVSSFYFWKPGGLNLRTNPTLEKYFICKTKGSRPGTFLNFTGFTLLCYDWWVAKGFTRNVLRRMKQTKLKTKNPDNETICSFLYLSN